jgi:hypothetical protein
MSNLSDYYSGAGTNIVAVTHWKDSTRRTSLANNNQTHFTNLPLCTKQSDTSSLLVFGQLAYHGGSGNNVLVPRLKFSDGTNDHEVILFYGQISASEGGYLTCNVMVPESGALAAGAITISLDIISASGTGNSLATSMNPTTSDDNRLYAEGHAYQWVSRLTVMELES